MATQITAAGVKRSWETEFQNQRARLFVDRMVMMTESDSPQETYPWLSPLPPLRRKRGDPVAARPAGNQIVIVNDEWTGDFAFRRSDWRDDKTGTAAAKIAESAQNAAVHPLQLIFDLLNAGTATTYGNAYTGTTFFGTHTGAGGFINNIAAAQVASLNIGTPTAPTGVEFATALNAVIAYMMGYVDENNRPLNEGAAQWLVITPPALGGAAMEAVYGANLSQGQSNPITGLKLGGVQVDVLVTPRNTDTDGFFLMRTDSNFKPIILQERAAAEIDLIGPGSEYERINREVYGAVSWEGGAGYGRPEVCAVCTFS